MDGHVNRAVSYGERETREGGCECRNGQEREGDGSAGGGVKLKQHQRSHKERNTATKKQCGL